jgi:hypothetical protein
MVTKIVDHAVRAVLRFIQQYKGKPKLEAMGELIGERAQEIEDIGYDMFTLQALDFAEGVQLDRFGEIVVQDRNGFDDDFYRILLKVKIGINNSSGDPRSIINTIKLLTQSTLVHYQNQGNASISLSIDTVIDDDLIEFIYTNMEKVVMAGVRIDAIIHFDPDESFSFDGTGPVGLGFSSLAAPTSGGKLAYIQRRTNPKFAFSTSTGVADPTGGGFGCLADPLAGGILQAL